MKKPVKIILIVLCVVFIGVFGFSAYKIVSTINGYKQAEKAYRPYPAVHEYDLDLTDAFALRRCR